MVRFDGTLITQILRMHTGSYLTYQRDLRAMASLESSNHTQTAYLIL